MRVQVLGIAIGAITALLPGSHHSVAEEVQKAASKSTQTPAVTAKATCTSEEIETLITGVREAQALAYQGDLRGLLHVARRLSRALSQTCQKAIAAAQGQQWPPPCSPDDVDLISDVLDQSLAAAEQGDFDASLRPLARLQAVSQLCQAAFAAAQQQQQRGRPARPFGAPASVEDHGNGLYVAPGVGYCDRGGCGKF